MPLVGVIRRPVESPLNPNLNLTYVMSYEKRAELKRVQPDFLHVIYIHVYICATFYDTRQYFRPTRFGDYYTIRSVKA